MSWIIESAGGSNEMTSATLGNLLASKIRVVSNNVTWSSTGYLWSQAGSSSGNREFGLFINATNYQSPIGGTTNSLVSVNSYPIVDVTVDFTVDYVAETAILIIDGVTAFSGAINAGTGRSDGEPLRVFARGGGFNAGSGTRIGHTEIYIDDILVRNFDFNNSFHGAAVVVVNETIGSDDLTGANMATDGSPWIDIGGGVVPQGTTTVTNVNPAETTAVVTYTYDDTDETGFKYRIDGGSLVDVALVNPFTISSLTEGTAYTVEVLAYNGDGDGTLSSPATNFTTDAAVIPAITTDPLKNNTGQLLTSETGVIAEVYDIPTGVLVVRKTGLTSDVTTAVVTFSDALMSATTEYRVVITLSGNEEGLARITTT